MLFQSDFDVLFNNAEFAKLAIWNSTTVNVIFDNQYAEMMGASGSSPFILVQSSKVTAASKGQTMLIDAVNYTIKTIEPDALGVTRMELHKA